MRFPCPYVFAVLFAPVFALLGITAFAQSSAHVLPEHRLNLRSSPTLESDVIRVLTPDIALDIVGRSSDGVWLQVATPDDEIGWVAAVYVDANGSAENVPVTYAADDPAMGVELAARIVEHLDILARVGHSTGKDAHRFAKVGDSLTATRHFLVPFGDGDYELAEFARLQDVIDYFSSGAGENPFSRTSLAAASGWTTSAVLDPEYADAELCQPDESPLACEYRVYRPAVALIAFGSNDVQRLYPARFEQNLLDIIALSMENGVIPVLATLPPRDNYGEEVRAFNQIVRRLGYKYAVPVWDLSTALGLLPGTALTDDGIHLTIPPQGYPGSANFKESNLIFGYVVRNLTALHALESLIPLLEQHYSP